MTDFAQLQNLRILRAWMLMFICSAHKIPTSWHSKKVRDEFLSQKFGVLASTLFRDLGNREGLDLAIFKTIRADIQGCLLGESSTSEAYQRCPNSKLIFSCFGFLDPAVWNEDFRNELNASFRVRGDVTGSVQNLLDYDRCENAIRLTRESRQKQAGVITSDMVPQKKGTSVELKAAEPNSVEAPTKKKPANSITLAQLVKVKVVTATGKVLVGKKPVLRAPKLVVKQIPVTVKPSPPVVALTKAHKKVLVVASKNIAVPKVYELDRSDYLIKGTYTYDIRKVLVEAYKFTDHRFATFEEVFQHLLEASKLSASQVLSWLDVKIGCPSQVVIVIATDIDAGRKLPKLLNDFLGDLVL